MDTFRYVIYLIIGSGILTLHEDMPSNDMLHLMYVQGEGHEEFIDGLPSGSAPINMCHTCGSMEKCAILHEINLIMQDLRVFGRVMPNVEPSSQLISLISSDALTPGPALYVHVCLKEQSVAALALFRGLLMPKQPGVLFSEVIGVRVLTPHVRQAGLQYILVLTTDSGAWHVQQLLSLVQ